MKDYPADYKMTKEDKAKIVAGGTVGAIAGGGLGYGAVKGARAIKKAGGVKKVAGDAAGAAKDKYRRTVGTPMARDNMKARGKAAVDSVVDPARGAAKKAVKKAMGGKSGALLRGTKKTFGFSSVERRRIINLEAQLDDALGL
jgi:hypothetical protein